MFHFIAFPSTCKLETAVPQPQTNDLPRFASACSDCNLCAHSGPDAPVSNGFDIDQIVAEVVDKLAPRTDLVVPVGVSARHCHVNQEAMDVLFGPGYQLNVYRELFQPGAFAAEEMISVVGPRLRAIERVRILGPTRGYNQVELARTDAIYLGVEPPVRDSGDLAGANPVTFIGPKGSITVEGAIRAARHIHMTPADVSRMELSGKERVRIQVSGEKGLTFENVRLKIDESYLPEIHLDTDDANAAELVCGDTVSILP
jgi:putative phosphotransacetylase